MNLILRDFELNESCICPQSQQAIAFDVGEIDLPECATENTTTLEPIFFPSMRLELLQIEQFW